VLRSFCRGLRHDLRHGGNLSEQGADQGRATHDCGRAVGEFDFHDAAANKCLAATGSLDRSPASERQACSASELVWREDVDRCAGARVAVSDPVGARDRLIEAGIRQSLMNPRETGRLDSQVDDDVDIVGRSHIERFSLDFEQEHHLATDEKAMVTECWRQLDESPP